MRDVIAFMAVSPKEGFFRNRGGVGFGVRDDEVEVLRDLEWFCELIELAE